MRNFIYYWLPVFLWAGLIFYLSNQPYLASNFPQGLDLALRKTAHVVEFFVLTFLLVRAFFKSGLKLRQALFLGILMTFAYAVSDEIHQGFIAGRNPAIGDVLIDWTGAVLSGFLFYFFNKS